MLASRSVGRSHTEDIWQLLCMNVQACIEFFVIYIVTLKA